MREIKFRAWDESSEVMISEYVDGVDMFGELKVASFHSSAYGKTVPKLKLMQFTGLRDKNGREIYEGDIYQYVIQMNFDGRFLESKHTAVVCYENGAFCVGEFLLAEALEGDDEAVIIGNIHENPFLLKGEPNETN